MTDKRLSAVLTVFLLLFVSVLSCGCSTTFTGQSQDKYPSIPENSATGEYTTVSHTFPFENTNITIKIPLDRGLYEAAYNADKSAYLSQDKISSNNWSSGYYLSFINDPSLSPLYSSILEQFRSLKKQMSLDSDRYAELILAYVESIPYKTDKIRTEPKFPVETVYENSGDCDDKSILTAALLSAEGYNVSLMEFEDDEHMSVGIKSPECSYKNTGYAYVEVTDYNYPGWPVIEIRDGKTLSSDPYIIRVGNGTTSYNSCGDVSYIYERMTEAKQKAESLEPRINSSENELEVMASGISSMAERMDSLKKRGSTAEYNSLVAEYNNLVNEYNSKNSFVKSLVSQYNQNVKIYNYIIENRFNRKGVYGHLILNP
ncbi:hypothetical protein J2128_000427 [Methanomicrobium sp. W14]|uniref:hypothetical protein n=1 Tax=Methanomicrobium sp. W14 TaxID=2817839 RepID=UPI001AE4DB96|nr:hypothetical protein [Methanomicrobium sp. W14]MBP2132506.1 hypothetical protein [Methanomicrobium sp. W14]